MSRWRKAGLIGVSLLLSGCLQQTLVLSSGTVEGIPDPHGSPFVAFKVIERTFTEGTTVVTRTYNPQDPQRTPSDIDFNGDGLADPVVGYGGNQAVVQILLTQAGAVSGDYLSLTLDSLRDMENLSAVAVGDIDGDGRLDIAAGTSTGVWYLRHPSAPRDTTDLRYWNIDVLDASTAMVDLDEAAILDIVADHFPPGQTLNDYTITTESLFNNVRIGDLDLDGQADIAASRFFKITLTPLLGGGALEVIEIVQGDIALFFNPGNATDGTAWAAHVIGDPERTDVQGRFDREGANGMLMLDLDLDGDLDLISAAQTDNNVQVAWFENPGGGLAVTDDWTQWRVGSVRDAFSIDVGDLTGDGLPDVVATGKDQQQVFLFPQPASGAKREYDWDSHVIVTFESFDPLDVKIADYDNDGTPELIVGCTEGAIRRFDPPANPLDTWIASTVMTFEEDGDVGSIGIADVDGDGDLDFIVVIDATEENDEFVAYIRNDT